MNKKVSCKFCSGVLDCTEGGPSLAVNGKYLLGMASLMLGELDHPRCEHCRTPFRFRQTLHLFLKDSVLIVPGTYMKGAPLTKLKTGLMQENAKRNNHITICYLRSATTLRESLLQRQKRPDPLADGVLTHYQAGTVSDYIAKHWREMTPWFFSSTLIRWIGQGAAVHDVLHSLYKVCVFAWLNGCLNAYSPNAESTFEAYLQDFVDDMPIEPAMVRELDTLTQTLDLSSRHIGQESFFCVEALRATLYQQIKEDNPQSHTWAGLLVGMELAVRYATAAIDPVFERLRISMQRARETLPYQQLYEALLAWLAARNLNDYEGLIGFADELGYPQLLRDLQSATRADWSRAGEPPPFVQMFEHMLEALKQAQEIETSESDRVMAGLEAVIHANPNLPTGEVLEALADRACAYLPDDELAQASVDTWCARHLNAISCSRLALARMEKWCDVAMPPSQLAAVYTECGTAWRTLGHKWKSRKAYQRARDLLVEEGETFEYSSNLRGAQRNLAIAYRNTGAPDDARNMLEALYAIAPANEYFALLESLCATCLTLGQEARALEYADAALNLGVGPEQASRPRLEAYRLMINSTTLDAQVMVDELLKSPVPPDNDPLTLLALGYAWINVLFRSRDRLLERNTQVRARFLTMVLALRARLDHETITVAPDLQISILSLIAHYGDYLEDPRAKEIWAKVDSRSLDSAQHHNVPALLALARATYREGDIAVAQGYLQQVPGSLAAWVGNVQQLYDAVHALDWYTWLFNLVACAIDEQPACTVDDYRLIAEVQRDAIRRGMRDGFREPLEGVAHDLNVRTFSAPSEEKLRCLAPDHGTLGVIEFIELGSAFRVLLTTIDSHRRVDAYWLVPPDFNVLSLAEQIHAKLAYWTSQQPGDPFDCQQWQQFEQWVFKVLDPWLPVDEHLVVIEHPMFAGLPWHVAAGARWSCSYASGWGALIRMAAANAPADKGDPRLGVACVRFQDDRKSLANVLQKSAARSERFARTRGFGYEASFDHACDHSRIARLLQECDTLKLLCHGYVSALEHEAALLLAHRGALPYTTDTPAGRQHLLSWRDIPQIGNTCDLVFSVACSSLRAHVVGQGERLGLFAALHECGTRSFVGPAWDVHPEFTLGTLDNVLETYLDHRHGLAKILRAECIKAANHLPRWQAWSLSIEGDWR